MIHHDPEFMMIWALFLVPMYETVPFEKLALILGGKLL